MQLDDSGVAATTMTRNVHEGTPTRKISSRARRATSASKPLASVRDEADHPRASAAMAFAIQEVASLLRHAEGSQLRMDASAYGRTLDEAAMALADQDAPVSSPLGALCSLLQDDRRLRYALAERCQSFGEV